MAQLETKTLRHIWGLVKKLADYTGLAKEQLLYDKIHFLCGKTSLNDLNKREAAKLVKELETSVTENELKNGYKTEAQWRKIKHLQRQLEWTDEHLRNYIKMVAKVDHERFLPKALAREVIAGLMNVRNHESVQRKDKKTG